MRKNEERFATHADKPTPKNEPSSFSVPTDLIKLPSKGKFYPEEHPFCNKEEIEIKFMTTKEEDILMSPVLNEKGIVFDRLIESISIISVDAKTLLLGDKNAILVGARKNAYGPKYEIEAVCENCFKTNELVLDLSTVEPKEIDYSDFKFTDRGTFILTMPKTKVDVELKLLTGQDEQEILKRAEQKQKHNLPTEIITDRYRQMVVSVDGSADIFYINNFIVNMPLSESRYFRKRYSAAVPDIDFSYKCTCTHCDHHNEGGAPITANFFWPVE